MKKSRGKRREIQQLSVQKLNNIRSRVETTSDQNKSFSLFDQRLSELSQIIWSYLSRFCVKFNLVPFQVCPDTVLWNPSSKGRITIHYILLAITFVVLLRNLTLCLNFTTVHGLNQAQVWSATFFLFSFTSFAGWIGSSFTPKEMMDLMNSWDIHLCWLEEDLGSKLSIFGSTRDNIKLIWTCGLFHMIPLEMTVGSVIIGGIPTTFFGFLQSLGFDPEGNDSLIPVSLIWRALLWPLDLVVYLPPASVAAFNVACMTLSYRLLRIYCNEMR